MKDRYYHKGMRRKLVQLLRTKGIADERVLGAIESIPRHFFLDNAFEELAYEDQALPIGNEQTISQPYTVAFQTELLDVQKGDKVLEIGTGSGYQAAVLAVLGAEVFTIERQEQLFLKTSKLLQQLAFQNIHFYLADGHEGLEKKAPFDKILVTAGATKIPESLKKQLKTGGTLVIPVGTETQQMQRIVRLGEEEFYTQTYGNFRFVPFKEGIRKHE